MKKNILKSLFVGMLCMLAASCQDTEELAQAVDSSKAQVMFSVAMDSQMARSRATWGDDYTPSLKGDVYDNHIELNQLVVKIEAGESPLPLYVKDIVKWKDGEANEYKFVGIVEDVDTETTLTNVKISVFANMGTDGKKETFKQDAENIPMWGMATMAELKLAPGTRNDDLEKYPIYLLRAMAKLEVSLNSEMAGEYALTGVKLNKHNPVGNCLPTIAEGAKYTTDLGLEDVKNVNKSGKQSELAFTEAEAGEKYIVYLPEVENGTSEADYLNIEVELTAKDPEGNLTKAVETGNFDVMDYSDVDNPTAIDIVRNHWYQYEISGFAASDGEVQVNYSIREWEDCGIDVGVGYLSLNKDLIEIFNSNKDEDQLKFNSSAPITSIELVDVYKHEQNGRFHIYGANEEKDGKSAYFIDKYGNLKSLQTEKPEIYNNISASWDEDVLNGDIIINSPFIGDVSSDKSALKEDSHDNSIRYLEFKVTNAHGLWATFRVMQYPPVVITNEKGYFSYRSDFVTKESTDRGEDGTPSHYLNFKGKSSITWSLINLVHIHKHDDNFKHTTVLHGSENFLANSQKTEYCWGGEPDYEENKPHWEEVLQGYLSYSTGYPVGPIYKIPAWKGQVPGFGGDEEPKFGITYYGDDGKLYKKHYTGNFAFFFCSKFVDETYNPTDKDGDKAKICNMYYSANGYVPVEGKQFLQELRHKIGNSRMYYIRTTSVSDGYISGYPTIDDGYTVINETNTKKVSPSFMVASQLGETMHISEEQCKGVAAYAGPNIDFYYELAKKHCKHYMEATYIDINGDGKYTKDVDEVKHYGGWRLPTLAEIELIDQYQKKSRAMDIVMDGEQYMCATPGYLSGKIGTETGRYVRCVRDVKPTDK